ncbi:ABC transporter permease [Desulfobacula phenolica]|nr:iron ABC transporter permease [Desulfobacula phenolica]
MIPGMLCIAALLWVLTGYILYPALKTVELSLTAKGVFSFSHYLKIFAADTSLNAIKNSIVLGGLSVVVCGVIGTALAFFVHYFEFPYKRIVDKLLLLPVMLPGLIIVFSFVQLYGESGLITKTVELILGLERPLWNFSGLKGILFVHAYTQYVYFYISVSIAIKHIDYSVVESARNLGASKLKVLTSVIFPFITPALIASSVITFMSGIGSFTAPSIIGGRYRVLTTQILLSKANNYMAVAAAQAVILTVISLFFFVVFRWYEKTKQFNVSVKSVLISPVKIENRFLKGLMLLVFGCLILTILLPVASIVGLSFVKSGKWMVSIYPREFCFENYKDILTRARAFAPFFDSILMALLASFVCLVIAVPSSYLIVKTKLKVKWIVEILTLLPWTMPASAIAINMINAYNQPNLFAFNAVLVGTYLLLPLGYVIRSIPIMVKTANISFQNLNNTYIEASKSLGASSFQTFAKIIVPIISPGLLAGFLLVFIRSIGEYTVSVFLYTASNKPVSIAMVNAIFEYNIGLAMAYGSLLIVVTAVLSLVISRLSATVL